MRTSVCRLLFLEAILVLGTLAQAAVAAQQPANSPRDQLEQVVITATKRRTTLQTTPISMTVLTGENLADRGLTTLHSLVVGVPGIAVRNSGSPGLDELEMRGLNSQGGNTSVVGLYLGSVPLSAPANSFFGKVVIDPNLYDLKRVEVLRGPQGTLYGSSSMGGTIRLIPNPPKLNTFSASGEEVVSDTTHGGNLNHEENGMVNIPLGHTAAVRLVGSFTRNSGFIRRLVIQNGAVAVDPGAFPNVSRPSNFYTAPLQANFPGANTTNVDQVRASLLWKPITGLTIYPMAMYERTYAGAPNEVDVNGNPTHPKSPGIFAHYEVFNAPEPQEDVMSFGSLKVVYDRPTFSLTSDTGYWHRNQIETEDSTELVAPAIGIPVYDVAAGGIGPNASPLGQGIGEQDNTHQVTEEFRLASVRPLALPRRLGHLEWLMGYFYQDLFSQTNLLLNAPQATPVFGGTQLFNQFQPQDIIQNAEFGHLSWLITSHWTLEAGFRHYHYSLSQTNSQFGLFTPYGALGELTRPFNSAVSIGASGTVPSVTAMYTINKNDMVYAKFSKGFRLGGTNQEIPVIAATAANQANTFDALLVSNECALQSKLLLTTTCNPNILLRAPETYGSDTLLSYELGEKSSFYHRRVMVDMSAYYEDWQHPQIETALSGFNLTVTGSDARIYGLEGQFHALLPRGFRILVNAAYTNAQFLHDSAITGFPAGSDIPDIPKVTASGVLSWLHNISDRLALFASIESDYVASRSEVPLVVTATLQNINQVLVTMPAYTLTNLRFGVRGLANGGDSWTATLFVNNLTNNEVLLDPQPQISLQTEAFMRYTIPRPLTLGIDLTYDMQ